MPDTVSITVEEVVGDQSETDVKLVLPKAAVPGFDPSNTEGVNATVVQTPIQGLSFLLVGTGELVVPDEEIVGDLDTEAGELVVQKDALGAQATPGTTLEGFTIQHQGQPVLLVPLSS